MTSFENNHKVYVPLFLFLFLSGFIFTYALTTSSHAQITLDGSLGRPGPVLSGTLPNGTFTDYLITHDLGKQVGSNLFHSFGKFSIETGKSGTFTGPDTINNVIGRVTGGEMSEIRGTLSSTIDGANLFLLNPAGVMFGPNARLDVKGSFHVSTADSLKFEEWSFYADPSRDAVSNSILKVDPNDFGFLRNPTAFEFESEASPELDADSTAAISIDGLDAKGSSVIVVGRDGIPKGSQGTVEGVKVRGELKSESGQITLASVAAKGEVPITDVGTVSLFDESGKPLLTNLGSIEISDGGSIDVSGNGGGTVVIRSGRLLIDNGNVFANTEGDIDGAPTGIDVQVTEDVVLTNESYVTADVSGEGNAGDIQVTANRVEVSNGAYLKSGVSNGSSGNAGQIAVSASNLELSEGGLIIASTFGQGNAGAIDVEVDRLSLTNAQFHTNAYSSSSGHAGPITITAKEVTASDSLLLAFTYGQGNAGAIDLEVDQLTLTDGAMIITNAFNRSRGDAGPITVKAQKAMTIDGDSSGLFASTSSMGNAGAIDLEVERLTLTDGALIRSAAFSSSTGHAGPVTITATEEVTVNDSFISSFTLGQGNAGPITITAKEVNASDSSVRAFTYGQGNAGAIDLEVDRLTLTNRAQIFTNAFGSTSGDAGPITVKARAEITIDGYNSGLFTDTNSAGNGGVIDLEVDRLTLTNGALIRSYASSSSTGQAGSFTISAKEVTASDSKIFTSTDGQGNAGAIDLEVDRITLTNRAQIFTNAFGSTSGDAGPLTVKARAEMTIDGYYSGLFTDTNSVGNGGVIDLEMDRLTLTNGALIRSLASSSSTGQAGSITISAKEVTASNSKIESLTYGQGNAGAIDLEVDRLTLRDIAEISSIVKLGSTGQGGKIEITAKESLDMSRSNILGITFASGDAGNLIIKAPDFVMQTGQIQTKTYASGKAGDINLDVKRMTLTDMAQINSGTDFDSTGQGGKVTVNAEEAISISGQFTVIYSETHSSGDAKDITITTPSLQMEYGQISATSRGAGNAGNIKISVDDLSLMGGARIYSSTLHDGKGGNIEIDATNTVTIAGQGYLRDSSGISTTASENGDAGSITLNARTVELTNKGEITADSYSLGQGNAGIIKVNVERLTLTDGGRIDSNTVGAGKGGTITVNAEDSVTIAGLTSGLSSNTDGSGDGGRIALKAPTIKMTGSSIQAVTRAAGSAGDIRVEGERVTLVNGARIDSSSFSSGPGGNIVIHSQNFELTDGALVSAESSGSGNAGDIDIKAINGMYLSDSSSINTEATKADGGNITLTAQYMVHLQDSEITASVGGGPETEGGNIRIDPEFVILDNSKIIAKASEGKGGNIQITAGVFIADPYSARNISASSESGISGKVDISAPVSNISGSLTPSQKNYLSAASLLRQPCAARISGGKYSSFVVGGRDGLPPEPGSFMPSPLYMGSEAEAKPSLTGVDPEDMPSIRDRFFESDDKIILLGSGLTEDEEMLMSMCRKER